MARFDSGAAYDSSAHYDEPPPAPASPKKHMAKVKLDLDDKNAEQVLAASGQHIAAMASTEGQALFPTPAPTVPAYQDKHDALAAGINLVTTLRGQLTAALNALPGLTADLKAVMLERRDYVQDTTGGDPALIPVSGFQVAGDPGTPIGPLPAPQNVKAVPGSHPATVKVSCKAVKGAQFYPVEARPHNDPSAPWVQVSVNSTCRQTISGLISGVEYAFRIAAKGAAGISPWGDEAVCRAP